MSIGSGIRKFLSIQSVLGREIDADVIFILDQVISFVYEIKNKDFHLQYLLEEVVHDRYHPSHGPIDMVRFFPLTVAIKVYKGVIQDTLLN